MKTHKIHQKIIFKSEIGTELKGIKNRYCDRYK